MGYNNNNAGMHEVILGDETIYNDYVYGSDRRAEVRFSENVLKRNPNMVKNMTESYYNRMLAQQKCK